MKILNVVSVYFSIPFFFGDQLLHFNKKGYDVHIACSPSDKLYAYSQEKKFKYTEIPIERRLSLFGDLNAVFKLYQYIKKNDFDIVCGHTAKGSLIALIASYIARTRKRIYFRHGFYYENLTGLKRALMLNLDRFCATLSTKIVCVSPFVLETSLKYRLNSRSKMVLLNIGSCNGVDALGKFNPANIKFDILAKLKQNYGLMDHDFVIGFTGRLVKDKGIVELSDAFKSLSQTHKNLKLLIVGPEEDRDGVPASVLSFLHENQDVIITGLIEENIQYYYEMMNILVLPTHREGLGTSILEASSMNKPVLSSDHTGSKDAMINLKTGLYIKPNADSILNGITYYLENEDLQDIHGKQGREFILKEFNQTIIWNEIEKNLYQN